MHEQLEGGIQLQRPDREFLLAINTHAGAAGDQDLESGAGGQYFGDRCRSRQDVLEVVQNEQERSRLLKLLADQLRDCAVGDWLDVEGLRQRSHHQIGVLDRGQSDELHAGRKPFRDRRRCGDRQAGLACASRTRQGQQTDVGSKQQLADLAQFSFPPDERSTRCRQIEELAGGLPHGLSRRRVHVRRGLDDLGGKYVAAARHGLEQPLRAVIQRATQLDSALHQGIVGHAGVGPQRLHQLLLADQAAAILNQVLEGLVHLGSKLDLLSALEHRPPRQVQGELAELVG